MSEQDAISRAIKIKLMIFDVDGVLTDGSLFMDSEGSEYKAFNSRDGHGIKMLQESGVDVGIITGRTSGVVEHRVKDLGIKYLYQGQKNKLPAYEALIKQLGLANDEVAYVGDDVVDLPVMLQVGLAVAVADAHALVKEHAHWQTGSRGGRGAGRDICEFVMRAQGTLDGMMAPYLCK